MHLINDWNIINSGRKTGVFRCGFSEKLIYIRAEKYYF